MRGLACFALTTFLTVFVLSPLGCGGGEGEGVLLTDDPDQLAGLVSRQYSTLWSLARNPGSSMALRYPTTTGSVEALELSFADQGPVNYRHVVVRRLATGEVVHLVWGQRGLRPTLRMVDERGNLLERDGQPLEFPFQSPGRSPRDWIEAGAKVAAVAFAVWLGAVVARAIVSAIAFLAFNAMLLGLLAMAAGVLVGVGKWVLEVTGITLQDVEALFRQSVEQVKGILLDIAASLGI